VARRKRKEDVPVWEPPEFDEVGYMRKEIENAKISVVVIAWSVVGAILLYLFYEFELAIVGFLLGLLIFGALYFLLPMLGLPIHGFKRRDWASHAMVYFFSWLAFSIILLNAPFSDHTAPVVGSFVAGTFSSNTTVTTPPAGSMGCFAGSPGSTIHIPSSGNNTVYVIFRATDNVGIRNVTARIPSGNLTTTSVAGRPNVCKGSTVSTLFVDTYAVSVGVGTLSFVLWVTATDLNGLTATESVSVASP
jgi:hypothetical protein